MAFIQNAAFEVKISNHEFDSIANITGTYMNASDAAEVVSSGFLCVRDALTPNEGYENVGPVGATITLENTNTWTMKAAAATDTAQKGIFAVNPFDVNMVQDPATGNMYKVGANTLGLAVPAGYRTTFTRIYFNNNNVYRFGIGNLSAALGENTFFTIANGLLVPAAAAPSDAGVPYFELIRSGTFTEGAYAAFDYVDVRACLSEA